MIIFHEEINMKNFTNLMSLVYNYIVTALCQIKKYFSDSYQEKLEQGLYNGILKALGEQYKKSGYATPTSW